MDTTIHALQQFWTQLRVYEKAQADSALLHAMQYLSGVLAAENAQWVMLMQGAQDNESGWQIEAIRLLHAQGNRMTCFDPASRAVSSDSQRIQGDVMHKAGQFRVLCFSHDFAEWLHDDASVQADLVANGIQDVMMVMLPLSPTVEAGFVFYRCTRCFNAADAKHAALASAPLAYLHKNYMLYHGMGMCKKRITPSEQRVLAHLVDNLTESQIAALTGLSQSTVHTYATRIYRKYGVKGRTGLMALWLTH